MFHSRTDSSTGICCRRTSGITFFLVVKYHIVHTWDMLSPSDVRCPQWNCRACTYLAWISAVVGNEKGTEWTCSVFTSGFVISAWVSFVCSVPEEDKLPGSGAESGNFLHWLIMWAVAVIHEASRMGGERKLASPWLHCTMDGLLLVLLNASCYCVVLMISSKAVVGSDNACCHVFACLWAFQGCKNGMTHFVHCQSCVHRWYAQRLTDNRR